MPLTPKALALLQALVEHRGDVVSKEELLGRVWPDAAVEEANLSVTVSALRKALGPQPDGRSYVQTVPRRGYRFDAAVEAERRGPTSSGSRCCRSPAWARRPRPISASPWPMPSSAG